MRGPTVSKEEYEKFLKYQLKQEENASQHDDCKPVFTLTIKSRCMVCDQITTSRIPSKHHSQSAKVYTHLGCNLCDSRLEQMSKEQLIAKVKVLVPYLKEFRKNMAKKGE